MRHVDLASDIGVGVDDFESGEVPELDGLLGEGVDAGDHGLGGDDGGGGGEEDDGDEGGFGYEAEEMVKLGFEGGFDVGEDECALAEVVQHQRGHDDEEPAFDEGRTAEVSDVGVHGFAAGDGEENEAHEDDAFVAVVGEEIHAVVGEQCGEDAWVGGDVEDTEDGEGEEPNDHDGAEGDPDFCGSIFLDEEESEDDGGCDGDDVAGEAGADFCVEEGESFDGGENGDGGGDDAVAVEQASAEDAHEDDGGGRARGEGIFGGAEEG